MLALLVFVCCFHRYTPPTQISLSYTPAYSLWERKRVHATVLYDARCGLLDATNQIDYAEARR